MAASGLSQMMGQAPPSRFLFLVDHGLFPALLRSEEFGTQRAEQVQLDALPA